MLDSIELSATWGPRAEAPEACAARLAGFLERLGTLTGGGLRGWKLPQSSASAARASTAVALDAGHLADLVSAALDPPASGSATELGALLSLWSGEVDGPTATVDLRCASTDPHVRNSIRLVAHPALVPDDGRDRELLHGVVSAWDPDRAVMGARSLLREQRTPPRFGWATYVIGQPSTTRPEDVPGALIEPLDSGVLVLTASGRSTTIAEIVDLRAAYAGSGGA